MQFNWEIFISLGLIAFALLFTTFLRTKIKFFQRYLIPNALTAGFILLPIYNYVMPLLGFNAASLKELAYHFLGLSFVVLTLKRPQPKTKDNDGAVPMAVAVLFQYAIQIMVGLLLTAFVIYTFRPELFHSFGLFLPLGFILGPGQALSIGESWGTQMALEGVGSVGLTFAAIGFIICCFGGIYLINFARRNNWIGDDDLATMGKMEFKRGIVKPGDKLSIGAYLTSETEAIDSMTLHIGLVLFTYFLSYLALQLITYLLSFLGQSGVQLAEGLWGLNFIFAAFTGMIVRKFMAVIKIDHIVDNHSMNRLSGMFVDIMVVSAIAAISIAVVLEYWLPILIVCGVGSIITVWSVIFIGSRLFKTHRFARTLLIFGCATGTLTTGIALLRVIDPDFKTPVVEDYTYGSGIVFAFAIPLIILMSWPVKTFMTGEWLWFWMFFGIACLYLVGCIIYYLSKTTKAARKDMKQVWFKKNVK